MRIIQYKTEEEKQLLLAQSTDNAEVLIGESNLVGGNFLTFCTINEVPQTQASAPTQEERIVLLQEAVDFILMNF